MYAVNVTIKVQNELAKKAIILALKDWSNDLFQNNGLMLRCFVDRTENQVEIFHVFRTKKETSREQIIELLNNSSGIKVIDNPESQEYPTPLENANDTEEVFVGRIRSQTINNENWISMWIVADNVYGKGAALNTVQILETLLENNKLC